MKYIGYFFTFVLSSVLSTIWSGYALSVLWGWFIVPLFNLPALSIPYAIGLTMLVTYLTYTHRFGQEIKDWGKYLREAAVYGVVKPGFALLFGWIVTLFI